MACVPVWLYAIVQVALGEQHGMARVEANGEREACNNQGYMWGRGDGGRLGGAGRVGVHASTGASMRCSAARPTQRTLCFDTAQLDRFPDLLLVVGLTRCNSQLVWGSKRRASFKSF